MSLVSFFNLIDDRLIKDHNVVVQNLDGLGIEIVDGSNVVDFHEGSNYNRSKATAALLRRFGVVGKTYQQLETIFNRWFKLYWDGVTSKFILEELDEANLPNVLNSFETKLKPFYANTSPIYDGTNLEDLSLSLYVVWRNVGSNVFNFTSCSGHLFSNQFSKNSILLSWVDGVNTLQAILETNDQFVYNAFNNSNDAMRRATQLTDRFLLS